MNPMHLTNIFEQPEQLLTSGKQAAADAASIARPMPNFHVNGQRWPLTSCLTTCFIIFHSQEGVPMLQRASSHVTSKESHKGRIPKKPLV